MKNLIPPKLLGQFQERPVPLKDIVDFLDSNKDVSTAQLCRFLDIEPSKVYNYRGNINRKSKDGQKSFSDVRPKAATKSYYRYSAKDKFNLVKEYLKNNDEQKSELLRKYGLYQSDISRWLDQVEEASVHVLGRRKTRSDKKTDEQLKIERLEKELSEQEKTTAKLSTLLILQKKTFDMLKKND